MTVNTIGAIHRVDELVVGIVTGINESGLTSVAFACNSSEVPVQAKSVVQLTNRDVGRQVVLMFENGDVNSPVVLGLIQDQSNPAGEELSVIEKDEQTEKIPDTLIIEDASKLTASKGLRLECGESSVTLTSAGKIIVQGNEIVTRSTGCTRLKGLSVELN